MTQPICPVDAAGRVIGPDDVLLTERGKVYYSVRLAYSTGTDALRGDELSFRRWQWRLKDPDVVFRAQGALIATDLWHAGALHEAGRDIKLRQRLYSALYVDSGASYRTQAAVTEMRRIATANREAYHARP